MSEILICPDIHGRDFWRPLLNYSGEIVCLGDYLDPYPEEGFSNETAHNNLVELVEFKKENPNRVTLLVGNHELHYIDRAYRSSRFSGEWYGTFHTILDDNKNLFKIAYENGEYLLTHAGVTEKWLEFWDKNIADLGENISFGDRLDLFFENNKMAYFQKHFLYRGGDDCMWGSPLWADIREFANNASPIVYGGKIYKQIVGHTQLIGVGTKVEVGSITDLDSRCLWLLDLKTGEIKRYE